LKPFAGFTAGTSTPVPDQFFDELMPLLGLAEMRILLFLIRCTFGSRRPVADVSLRQMMEGVSDAEGYPLAPAVGMSKATVCRALANLRRRQVIIAERQRSKDQGNEPTRYRLNMGFF
jgi:transcription initiation factor IIE alpha subunit